MTKRKAYTILGAAAHKVLTAMNVEHNEGLLDLALTEIETMERLANLPSDIEIKTCVKKFQELTGYKSSSTIVRVGYAKSATAGSVILTVEFAKSTDAYLYVLPVGTVSDLMLSVKRDPDGFSIGSWVAEKLKKPSREFEKIDREVVSLLLAK